MAVTLFHKVINYNNNYVKVTIRNKPVPKPSNLSMSIKMKRDYSREVEKK